MTDLPSYEQLAEREPPGSSWGLWGKGDVFGCLNLIMDPSRAKRGAACVRKGSVFALNLEQHLPDPPLFGRPAFTHDVTWLQNEAGHDETLSGLNTQSSAQWDGFRHIKHPVHGFYNGVADEEHGVGHWAARGLAGRGVLADVARWREEQGRPLKPDESDPIEASDITGTLDAQGVEVEPGDVLIVRTGWLAWYRSLDPAGRKAYAEGGHACVGLRPGEDMWSTLWDLHIAAIAADNPALEVWPPAALATEEQLAAIRDDPSTIDNVFMHFRLLPLFGLPIGELWDTEPLADDCAADGVYEFQFTSAPLRVNSGVASPPNALAIK